MQQREQIKLIATDLDGTFLHDDKTISTDNLISLIALGGLEIIRVAATGRSMHKVNEVLPPETPFDYIVFSSGAGVYDWNEKKILVSEKFEPSISAELCRFLIQLRLNFFVFQPIPENNLFHFHKGANRCPEFESYLHRHNGDHTELDMEKYSGAAGQFMSIIPNEESLFLEIQDKLNAAFSGIRVIRTTSPVNTQYLWLEIFPDTVSKGHGLQWLCNRLGIEKSASAGVGNDYNDLDMLNFVRFPFVLGNSPEALHRNYKSITATNNGNGFSEVVKQLSGKLKGDNRNFPGQIR